MDAPNLILPDSFLPNPAKYQQDVNDFIKNQLLNIIYKAVCQKKDNDEINKALKTAGMNAMPADVLNRYREFFKAAQHHHPEKMAQFRRNLGLN